MILEKKKVYLYFEGGTHFRWASYGPEFSRLRLWVEYLLWRRTKVGTCLHAGNLMIFFLSSRLIIVSGLTKACKGEIVWSYVIFVGTFEGAVTSVMGGWFISCSVYCGALDGVMMQSSLKVASMSDRLCWFRSRREATYVWWCMRPKPNWTLHHNNNNIEFALYTAFPVNPLYREKNSPRTDMSIVLYFLTTLLGNFIIILKWTLL